MTSSSLITAVASADLLGSPSGDLVLRLCNTAQEGRLIRLSASKCSIGSARDDTLRLYGPGVVPTHCLILRGRDQTVVRRWAGAVRLNDRPLFDAPLKIGDRLGVGPLELEVVANASSEPIDAESWIRLPTAEESDRELDFAEQMRCLEEQAASLAEQRTSMAREAEVFARQAEQAAQESRALEVEKEAFAERRQALARELQVVEQLERDLESREQALDAQRLALQAESESLRVKADESLNERPALELLKQSMEADRDDLTKQREALASERQSLKDEQSSLIDKQNAFDTDAQELSRDREALQVEWQTLDMQLQGVAAERQMVVSQRQSLELQQQRLATEQLALETCRQMVESERRALESRKAQVSAEATGHSKRMSDQAAAVAAAREAFERQREHWQSERDQIQAKITVELDRCQRQLADLNRLREEFDRERTAWDERRQMIELELATRCERLDRQARELEANSTRLEERQAVSVEPVPSHHANDDEIRNDEEVFARLRAYSLLKPGPHDESDSQGAALKRGDGMDERSDEVAALTGERDETAPTTRAADNEESIDDYMARLLNRIRTVSGPNEIEPVKRPQPRPTKVATPPVAVSPLPAESSVDLQQADTPTPRQAPVPVQLVARSAAPESAVNLKAMRDLANMTTRGAIDKHAQGRWSKAVVGKIIGGSVSFVCGVWLMFSHSSAFGVLSRFMGFAGVVAGLVWIVQAALLVRNLRLVGRRTNKPLGADMPASDLEGTSPADEPNASLQETAAESSAELSAWTERRRSAHRAFQNGARRVASAVRRIVEYARRG